MIIRLTITGPWAKLSAQFETMKGNIVQGRSSLDVFQKQIFALYFHGIMLCNYKCFVINTKYLIYLVLRRHHRREEKRSERERRYEEV